MTTRDTAATSLKRQVRVNASPETVYKYLTEAALIAKWFGRKVTFEAKAGGACRIEMNDRDVAAGKIVELKRPEKVVYTFGWEAKDNPIRPGSTTVEITLKPEGAATLVTLVHTGLPAPTVEMHGMGWDLYMGRLAVAATGGNPGPDPNATPRDMH